MRTEKLREVGFSIGLLTGLSRDEERRSRDQPQIAEFERPFLARHVMGFSFEDVGSTICTDDMDQCLAFARLMTQNGIPCVVWGAQGRVNIRTWRSRHPF